MKRIVIFVFLFFLLIILAVKTKHENREIKTPREIYSIAEKSGVIIKHYFNNNLAVCSGVIVKDPSYPEPFILSAGHTFILPLESNGKFTACFNKTITPEEIEPIMLDLQSYSSGGLDFSAFRFKTSEVAKRFNSVALRLGSSNDLKISDPVFTLAVHVGRPFGFSQGTVFGLNSTSNYYGRPQTIIIDSLFGPGSSGGATLNSYGELIGLNNSIIPDEYWVTAYGVVPVDDIKKDLSLLTVSDGQLMIVTHPIANQIEFINSWEYTDKELADWGLKRPSKEGVIVKGFPLSPFIPAAEFLQKGDLVISVENKPIKTNMDAYRSLFFCYKKNISMVIERDEKEEKVEFELINPGM